MPIATTATKANAVADCYKRKTVTLVVAFGAGGRKAANYMYSAAPKDGSYMAELSKDTAVSQVLRPKKFKYNAANFQYLGRMMPCSSSVHGVTQGRYQEHAPRDEEDGDARHFGRV